MIPMVRFACSTAAFSVRPASKLSSFLIAATLSNIVIVGSYGLAGVGAATADSVMASAFLSAGDAGCAPKKLPDAAGRALKMLPEDAAGTPKMPPEDAGGAPKMPPADAPLKLLPEDAVGAPKMQPWDSGVSPEMPREDAGGGQSFAACVLLWQDGIAHS